MKFRTSLHDPHQVRDASLDGKLAPAAGWMRSAAPAKVPPTRPAPPPRRRRLAGALFAAGVGAVVAGLLVSNHYETDSLGQRIDATVERGETAVRGLAGDVQQSTDRVAERMVQGGADGMGRAAQALSDAGITASIKAALAADPALSAWKIDVSTDRGVVTLRGPAADAAARDRATVLAQAPAGVQSVNNELAVGGSAAPATPPVAGGS